MPSPETIKQALKTEANHLGFVLFGCSQPFVSADFERFEAWIQNGFGKGMPYLSRPEAHLARKDPNLLLPGIHTVISLAIPYPLLDSEEPTQETSDYGRLASYACLEDYHVSLKNLAVRLASNLEFWTPGSKTLVCVDTAPILEKAYAQQAGLGWIGQNTLLFNPEFGSRLLLAEILTTLELPMDQSISGDPCIDCGLCLEACPTGALVGNRNMDSNRCLSFLTIENRIEIPIQFRQNVGNRVFGCDACQLACPYNQTLLPAELLLPLSKHHSPAIDLQSELGLNPDEFKTRYAGTPILRAKHNGFIRNLILAAGNSGNPGFLPQLQALQGTVTESMLQETLDWAIRALEIPNSAN
ncbi:MAG TPA: tRNA epoxyqueuosine(34) reductase QueG [Anaerolineaceae bacterium]|nr:tRNA epoxyqueuosine(34) reductase QueG [Anaerolineaceae bacterium]